MALFDVHAHLTHPKLRDDTPAILERARAAGVAAIISNGLNLRDNLAVRELASQHRQVLPAFGFYPVDAVLGEMRAAGVEYPGSRNAEDPEETIAWVAEHAQEAIAIGEIGLDAHWVPEQFLSRQEDRFRQLVQIAIEAQRPIIIHSRKRERRCFDILVEMQAPRVNWHCYSSKFKLARSIAEQGHYLSVPAHARRAESFRRMLEKLPREQLLLETDAPYLSPQPGTLNEPAHVRGTAQLAGELWGLSEHDVTRLFAGNFERLFGRSPDVPDAQ